MRATGFVGVDGSGGQHNKNPRLHSTLDTRLKAMLHSAVPGNQTVPRAEVYSVLCVLSLWDGSYPLTIITDASYTIQGLAKGEERRNTKGVNADLWKLLYDELVKH